jgi:hypothetical protein
MSMGGFRSTTCVQCGGSFMDDCGDSFCSSSCEKEYDRQHEECSRCGCDVGEDNLVDGICWDCDDENNECEDDE